MLPPCDYSISCNAHIQRGPDQTSRSIFPGGDCILKASFTVADRRARPDCQPFKRFVDTTECHGMKSSFNVLVKQKLN